MNKMAARTTHITMMQVSKTLGGGLDSVIGPRRTMAKRTDKSFNYRYLGLEGYIPSGR